MGPVVTSKLTRRGMTAQNQIKEVYTVIVRCLKCGKNELHYKGCKTGETAKTVKLLRQEIHELLGLDLNRGSFKHSLCIDCMNELLIWLKDKDAHVRLERKIGAQTQWSEAVQLQRERDRFAKIFPTGALDSRRGRMPAA
jgi:hypothetical protein